jgi:copper(I)-binding protein
MEDGQAEMLPIEAVVIPAGDAMAFEPGGYHVMLFDLAEPLTVGETISLVLTFEEAGEIEVEAEIREFVEGDMGGGMGGDTGSET